ncbi:MAG: AarF/UbiB family protein [Caldilineaceae bacterium]
MQNNNVIPNPLAQYQRQNRIQNYLPAGFRQRAKRVRSHWQRYSKVGWFLVAVFLHLLWWDGLFTLPLLGWLRPTPQARWTYLAQRYCILAMELGGLLVKVGQFLSLRIDLLPTFVTQELANLQDRMKPESFAVIAHAIEAELARPLSDLFLQFSAQPLASASVAQVHAARLYSGENVVVKILRPGTVEQFEMDLTAFRWLVNVLNLVPWVRRSFNLSQLLEEFTTVTRNELDLRNEGRNAERFAQAIQQNHEVYIPKVYWSHSSISVLTMENVGYLKLNDVAAIEAAGINITKVANSLAQLILQQIFTHHFVHADPHPGNVFVKPLPHSLERKDKFIPGEAIPYSQERPFQIVFIDFGMAVEIPPKERAWLRDFVIGLGLRDPQRIVQAYIRGNLLRPGVDIERVEAFTADLLNGFQDMLVGLMPDSEDEKTQIFVQKHGDMLGKDYPFQIPMNLLFMYRALGTVGGVVKRLDPTFDLSSAAAPYAIQLVVEEWQQGLQTRLQAIGVLGQLLLTTPMRLDLVLSQAQKVLQMPELMNQQLMRPLRNWTIKTELTSEDRKTFRKLEGSVQRLNRAMTVMGALAALLLWYVGLHGSDILTAIAHQGQRFGGTALALSFTIYLWGVLRGRL